MALTKLENFADSWFAFDHAIKISPNDPMITKNYLLCILESGDIRKFESIFKKTKAFTPEETKKVKRISIEYKNALGFLDSKKKTLRSSAFGLRSVMESKRPSRIESKIDSNRDNTSKISDKNQILEAKEEEEKE